MGKSNRTACESWRSYSFDIDLSTDYPGRVIGLSRFTRDGRSPQVAPQWDQQCCSETKQKETSLRWQWATRKQRHFWWGTHNYMKKHNHKGQETRTSCLLEQLKHGAQSPTLRFWDSTFLAPLQIFIVFSLLGEKFSADLLVKQQERQIWHKETCLY